MDDQRLDLHLVSDATGETLNAIARATVSQFEHVRISYHRWTLIRTRFQLHRVLEGIESEPGPVLSTVIDKALRDDLETFCARLGVAVVNVLDPVLSLLQETIGAKAAARPGRQYVLDADYFRRIDAMHFVVAHDDGQAQAGIAEAEVVLVGVSRSSKTPTSFYLANRGVKAANVPLVPGLPDPPGLENPTTPVIGLTLDPRALIEIRRHRLKLIAHGDNTGVLRQEQSEYVDLEAVKAELLWARRICNPPRMAGHRRDQTFDRRDGRDGAAAHGGLASPPGQNSSDRRETRGETREPSGSPSNSSAARFGEWFGITT